jgi:hypothetical protein
MRIEFSRPKEWDFYYLMKGWIDKRRKGLLQTNKDVRTKLYIGDSTCWLGLANLTHYSLADNYEVLVELTPIPYQVTEYFQKL